MNCTKMSCTNLALLTGYIISGVWNVAIRKVTSKIIRTKRSLLTHKKGILDEETECYTTEIYM